MSANRKRSVQIIMRLTEEEHDILKKRMHDIGIKNRGLYLRNMALAGYILKMDLSEIREMLRLLSNIASNVNQIAARVNETRSIYAQDMVQLQEDVSRLRSQVSEALKVFGKVRKLLEIR